MKVGIGFDGSMVILDSEGKRHIFCPIESERIRYAVYKWVQKKNEGIMV